MLKRMISLILIMLLLGGCSGSNPEKISKGTGKKLSPQDGGTLRLACVPVDTLNPLITQHTTVDDILCLVYEGLFRVEEDLSVKPVLASEYVASEYNTIYTIKLKTGITFHNGQQFSAADVVATLGYLATYGGHYSAVMTNIQNYWSDSSDTVIVQLKRGQADFMNLFDFPILPAGLTVGDFAQTNESFIPVGTGKYCYSDALKYKNIYLKAFETWHGEKKSAYIKDINVEILSDESTIISAFDAGAIDVISTAGTNWDALNLTSNLYNTFESASNRLTFIGINCNSDFMSDKAVRSQLASVINKKELAENILLGHAVSGELPVRDEAYYTQGYHKSNGASEKQTKDNVAESSAEEKTKLTILYNADSKTKQRLAIAVKQQLETKGIATELDPQPFEQYCGKIESENYQLYVGEISIDASANLLFAFSDANGNGQNICNYSDEQFENLLLNLDRMTGKEDRRVAWNNFADYYLEAMPLIPLYFTTDALFVNERVKGTVEPGLSNPFKDVGNLFIKYEEA